MNTLKDDTKYRAITRQLQDDWRTKHNLPIGTYTNPYGEVVELGNYIERAEAYEKGVNFLTQNIRDVVALAIENKEIGAKMERKRLYSNLLSSQALAFNLFAELSLDLNLATDFFTSLFPNRIEKVTRIIFEHSKGRSDKEYIGDNSAFDVFVEYKPIHGEHGFIALDVKYSESLNDAAAPFKKRYEELSKESKLYKFDSIKYLNKTPIQQIWRDHLLAISYLKHANKLYDDGFFVYLYPKENAHCRRGVSKYINQFISFDYALEKHNEKATGFYPRHLEDFVAKLQERCKDAWVNEFSNRYLGTNL